VQPPTTASNYVSRMLDMLASEQQATANDRSLNALCLLANHVPICRPSTQAPLHVQGLQGQ